MPMDTFIQERLERDELDEKLAMTILEEYGTIITYKEDGGIKILDPAYQ